MSAESPSYTVPLSPPSCGPPMSARNVIIFGESGVGKSSIVNMLLGERQAPTSTSARGCTIASVPYDVDFGDGVSVRVHDTAGLDESSAGTVKPENAVANLYNLLCKLEDGISLLVFVTRLGRITKRNQKNYRLFFDGICQGNVPIVLVVTHGEDACEDDDDDIGEAMDRWWRENAQHFQRNEMFFDGQAVVVAENPLEDGRARVGSFLRKIPLLALRMGSKVEFAKIPPETIRQTGDSKGSGDDIYRWRNGPRVPIRPRCPRVSRGFVVTKFNELS